MPFSFETLDVYGKALALGIHALEVSKTFPESYGALGSELARTAISVSSDIAAGASLWVRSKKKELFHAARASCFKCASMFGLGRKLGIVQESEVDGLNEQVEAISKMLTKLAQSVDKEKDRSFVSARGSE
jgi:four helix bundle protein